MAYNKKKKDYTPNNKVQVTDLMTGFEVRTGFGYKRTASDEIKSEQMLKKAVQRRLNMEVEVTLPSGEVVNVPSADLLVDAKFQHDLEHPNEIDLVKWGKSAGEDTVTVENNLHGAEELFGDIVIKK